MNTDIIRHINSARDVLVGKVPDPKAQVDQITTALIYKFMDDMDKSSQEIGGKASFFTGEYEKYAWSKLMDSRLGGQDKLNLYSEAITTLSQNPKLPPLFRDIFKDAFLPYRDPETLNLFLKEINFFDYDHSENLGDAFEYLLSVLGSQGDAGQFRTPRHIIDFIVEVVQPKKTDTILDPACGTAGFLISAYKYIQNNNDGKDNVTGDQTTTEKPLTPDEKDRLIKSIVGYDISPDMVRLSLVNMYLHGFVNPKIYEYDTLTSEEKWDENYDVIMANPPFMSPKGGIKPHSKFSVKANRSEVLFVDYIMNHLKPKGRAGIIVPEGIIFQSATAYKQLRKNLLEDGLYAVVSLPSGVFNPYAGVKTSILLFDNEFAKQTKEILFIKIENDGFGLGAQRRPIDKNDLPQAIEIIGKWKGLEKVDNSMVAYVERNRIVENDYNLSADRYLTKIDYSNAIWPIVSFDDVVTTITPPKKILKEEYKNSGIFPIIDQSQEYISGWTDKEDYLITSAKPLVIFGDHTCVVKYAEKPFAQGADGIKILQTKDQLFPKYLYYILKTKPIISEGYKRHFSKLKMYRFPLPPLEVQEKIVAELDGYQKIIDGAKMVVGNWKPDFTIDSKWVEVRLGDVVKVLNGRAYKQEELLDKGKYPVLRVGNFFSNRSWYYSDLELEEEKYCIGGDLLFAWSASFGPRIWDGDKSIYHYHIWKIIPSKKVNKEFLLYYLEKETENLKKSGGRGMAMMHLTKENFESTKLFLPEVKIQKEIVEKIKVEYVLIENNRKLIKIYEDKIDERLKEVWGD